MKQNMNRYALQLILLCTGVLILSSCREEDSLAGLGIEERYVTERMQKLLLSPEYPGEYEWSMRDSHGNDSVVSSEREFIFISHIPGRYDLKVRFSDLNDIINKEITIDVWEEQVAYSPFISRVFEYCPAPGQYINVLPEYSAGDTPEAMRQKAEESISGKNGGERLISLGGFGGYVTFGFDHPVMNLPGRFDFRIEGNALSSGTSGNGSEPGIVMVSLDRNNNGIPDDEWYELAGSEYYKPETDRDYSITFYRPDPEKVPEYKPQTAFTDTTYIYWEDNRGETGYLKKNTFHTQSYYPEWIPDESLTLAGTRLADNSVDINGNGVHFVQYTYDWGYVDNHPNTEADKISFNLEWAVDRDGNRVYLPCVDFIRVYTAVRQQSGWLGETSTEICRAHDLHIEEN